MKRNTYIKMLAVLLTLTITACNKDLTEIKPDSVLTTTDYYKTAKDLDLAVIGIYSSYQSRKPTDYILLELPTDNLYRTTYTLSAGADDVDNMAITSANQLFATFWEASYSGIFRANVVLANIDNPEDYKAKQKEQLIGEAKFMRALFYFDMVRLFGGVPKVTTLLEINEAKSTPRASKEEIYSLIISDLKDALATLPAKADMPKGRVSNGVAAALLGKVYVYLKDWPNAKTYLDMVAGYGYALQTDFAALWKLENEDNAELIFAIKYIEGTNGHALSSAFLPFGGKTGIASSGLESVFPSWDLHKLFEVGDTRKAASITEFYKTPTPANSPTVWFPHVSKYEVKHLLNSSGIDLPVLRYADVILLLAEVQYGLNRPDLALAELNKIRSRAFGNATKNYTLADIATADAFTDKILLERRLEFAFENERWFDLVRTGRLLTELAFEERGYNPTTQTALKFTLQPKPNYVLFPIPQRQIEVYNPGILAQNQDY
ncbi:hypothetical protein ABIE26_002683 [Pedobacter africanus]|uniref:Uncharacterized protein n=1 Tax=Pedobacter africanus TaxID=151894 RepID=A0ACC6KX24_9SPHI|nr:RagB/SusD family nutrient uptake outer membrane protein [Pedobacter africanus]MDR6783928.1 hypothetical protein [Pedobacter africanus]